MKSLAVFFLAYTLLHSFRRNSVAEAVCGFCYTHTHMHTDTDTYITSPHIYMLIGKYFAEYEYIQPSIKYFRQCRFKIWVDIGLNAECRATESNGV